MYKKISAYIFLCVAVCATSSSMRAAGGGDVLLINATAIVQPFDGLATLTPTPSESLPTGWYVSESGSNADGRYIAGTGSSNGGNTYSFGLLNNADRALGSVGSGSLAASYGARLMNAGSGPITALAISFDGEMWRRGTSSADRLTFAYSTNASDLVTGTFTNFAELDFASPGAACTPIASGAAVGASNGNVGACKVAVSGVLSGLSINPGASIWIKWSDSNSPNDDDGLAIDNVSIAATFSTDPTPPNTSGASASPSPASPGDVVTLSGSIISGFNPISQSYTVACDLTSLGGSASQTLPVTGMTFSLEVPAGADATLGASALSCSISDDQSRSTAFTIPIKILLPLNSACEAVATNISAIQGTGMLSPLAGEVVDVEAIVTRDFQGSTGLSGFYIEEPAGERDTNPATSEGLFIFSSTPVAARDRVRVRGTVAEFASATGGVTSRLTELGSVSSVQVCRENEALPPTSDVTLPVDAPSHWERYEGMQVRFTQQLVVAGNVNLGNFGQIDLAPRVLYQPTHSVGNTATWSAAADLIARSRIALDDGSTSSNADINGGTVAPYPAPGLSNANTLRVGALVNSNGTESPTPLVGVLDDRFGAYRVHPTEPVTFSNASNPRPDTVAVAAAAASRFAIVNANVLNFFTTLGSRGAATTVELINQRAKLVAQLAGTGGDIIGLSEIQNFENGNTNGGTYTNSAIADLTTALAAATGRNYQYVDTLNASTLAPRNVIADNGTDAIRNAIIYDADAVTPVGYTALYYQNDQNRPSLAQTFQPASGPGADAQTFTVVVNHFRSKGSSCGAASDDPFQGNCNGMRVSMAGNVSAWLATNPTADPATNRRQILIGDFNAYFGEDPIQMLLGPGGYTNLIDLFHGPTAYSYNFASQLGYLDHALVNAAALGLVKDVAHLHINADEPAALQALGTSAKSVLAQAAYYAPNEFAASDHDPIVVGFNPLAGDFSDDGVLDDDDRTALLAAAHDTPNAVVDRRMDMNGDGAVTQADFHVWQSQFIAWKKRAK
jgi:predicted extracellular nuclease